MFRKYFVSKRKSNIMKSNVPIRPIEILSYTHVGGEVSVKLSQTRHLSCFLVAS